MLKFLVILMFLSITAPLVSAQVSESKEFTVKGVIHSLDATVFPGLRLRFKGERVDTATFIDMDGRFQQPLSDGDYVVTIDGLSSSEFRVFIKVGKDKLNPNFLTFV